MNTIQSFIIPESTITEEPSRSLVDAFEDMLREIYYDSYVDHLKEEDQNEYNRQLFYFLQLYS